MTIYRYFFWVEETEIEVYKNGKLIPYRAEKKANYSKGLDVFFDLWKDTASYIDGEAVDFTFIGKNKKILEKFIEFCNQFPYNSNTQFTFENLKSVIDDKDLKKFCVEVGEKQYFLQKTEFNYNRIPKNTELEKIYIYGKNIKENLLSDGIEDMEIQTKDTNESKMASFFRSRLQD